MNENDDLGRGMVTWDATRFTALDDIATEWVAQCAVLRSFVELQPAIGQTTVRISGKDVTVVQIYVGFEFDMTKEANEDLDRKVRLAAQDLANAEDAAVLKAMNPVKVIADHLGFEAFIKAKALLKNVQQGFGVVVSPDVQAALDIQQAGVRSGLELVERSLVTKVVQTNALPEDMTEKGAKSTKVSAVVLQASPAVHRLVQGSTPQLRVLGNDGTTVRLQVEEWIAVGELESDRCVGIKGKV
jgi:hypothetical protein